MGSYWLCLLLGIQGLFLCESQFIASPENLNFYLRTYFSYGRSHLQEQAKEVVREEIREFFLDLQLRSPVELLVDEQHFQSPVGELLVDASNIILIMPGTRWGTPEDAVSVLGAHYDSQLNTPGVDDNGSGMAGLFEAARMLTLGVEETLTNTVVFVAFDLEEMGLLGSEKFVDEYLLPEIIQKYNINPDRFQGALILETIMNWDSTPNTQFIPDVFVYLFPDLVEKVRENEYRGDFLTILHRRDDKDLADMVASQWEATSNPPILGNGSLIAMPLPVSGRPDDLPPLIWNLIRDAWRSDHYRFWNAANSQSGLKALFITDTAEFRGYMQRCYHEPCDSVEGITNGRLVFLAKVTTVMANVLLDMANDKFNTRYS